MTALFRDHTRRGAERYYALRGWSTMPTGGHFAPMEEPDLVVADIRGFFGELRDQPISTGVIGS